MIHHQIRNSPFTINKTSFCRVLTSNYISKMTSGPVTQRFGPEVRTYFTGNTLNRYSWLREDYQFLHLALQHPTTRFLPLNSLNPILDPDTKKLKYWKFEDVAKIVGRDCYAHSEEQQVQDWASARDAVGVNRVLNVFLGVDENDTEGTLSYRDGKYKGRAYFAVDVTGLKTDSDLKRNVDEVISGVEFTNIRNNGVVLHEQDAALYSQARMYVDWNNRNRFCGGCGHRLMSVNGGCKLLCPSHDDGKELPECDTRGRISNLSFPRTDCVVIVTVVDYAGERILLGNNKRYPDRRLYSCLAGFLEPAESIEEAARREVYEESGVKVGNVQINCTQPWPYPANIMVGCIAEVLDSSEANHQIHLGHDPELVDARWVTFADVRAALKRQNKELFLPPKEAIAHVLIDSVVNGNAIATAGEKPHI